ncbi:hypothetical protein ECANGB1_2715 [Enterospora canceri]|uniref:Secreted protein n=1 Tax=Enterospora canceri TaxID=1081671 RepID=A0A1Y1S5B5_9MICR|nr:hypothetical protein ECANGB1_2715 [Enterospora canceri]
MFLSLNVLGLSLLNTIIWELLHRNLLIPYVTPARNEQLRKTIMHNANFSLHACTCSSDSSPANLRTKMSGIKNVIILAV